ncbi:hypothetical protein COV11_00085, partial [Candidatus Woesearchaeota archaeon CG10_big_fil_rev_8_21_14_0_10_30_7]
KLFFPKYIDSVFYSQVFSLSLLWIVSIPADSYLAAKKKIKEQYVSNIAISIAQVVFLFIGITLGGLLGLIVARIATNVSNSILSIVLYNRASKNATAPADVS